jgi:hypothetical protein
MTRPRPITTDVAAWMPKNAILSAEGAGTMDIGLTQLRVANARSCRNAGTYGTMGSASAKPSPPASCIRTGRSSTSPATRRSASPAWRWRPGPLQLLGQDASRPGRR